MLFPLTIIACVLVAWTAIVLIMTVATILVWRVRPAWNVPEQALYTMHLACIDEFDPTVVVFHCNGQYASARRVSGLHILVPSRSSVMGTNHRWGAMALPFSPLAAFLSNLHWEKTLARLAEAPVTRGGDRDRDGNDWDSDRVTP